MDILLWGVLPYVMMVVLVGGLIWRYKYDQFGWTTRSSQLYESRLLHIGSPVFHFGLLAVIAGHFFGLVIPGNDKMMYVVLTAAIVFGLWTTLASVFLGGEGHNYRATVSPWFRSLFIFQPDIAAMANAPFSFHLHTLVGMLLFTIWPFTRLVHAFTAPLHYLFRPYIVYRSRDKGRFAGRAVAEPVRRGWSAVGTRDRDTRNR